MAFTGVAVVKRVSDNMVRITGLSLAAGATGTISQAAGAGAVKFPDGMPPWTAYEAVTLQDAVEVSTNPASDVSNFAIPIRVTKTGVDASNFLITLENDAAATASANLDIYVKFHL